MPKTSSLLVWEPSRLRTLALHLPNGMVELRLSKRALVKHYKETAETNCSLFLRRAVDQRTMADYWPSREVTTHSEAKLVEKTRTICTYNTPTGIKAALVVRRPSGTALHDSRPFQELSR